MHVKDGDGFRAVNDLFNSKIVQDYKRENAEEWQKKLFEEAKIKYKDDPKTLKKLDEDFF